MTKCRHKPTRLKHINSCVSRCLDCGMLYAMIVGRTCVMRRWVQPDDPRVELGTEVTIAILKNPHRGEPGYEGR